jgi:hypothetical protein
MSFGWFLAIGWIHIKCRHCSARLVLKSLGERFWAVLAGGAALLAAIVLFLDFSFRSFGEKGVLFLFLGLIFVVLYLSMYVAWKDSRYEVLDDN